MNASDREDVAERVRGLCLELPDVTERVSHGAPAFFVGKQFLHLWARGHHDNEFPHIWAAAPAGAQAALIDRSPTRFFRPPYVGHRGWIGMRIDGDVGGTELADVVEDAYRCMAPTRLLAQLDGERGPGDACAGDSRR